MTATYFHLAIPVDDLAAARRFYGTTMGCPEGRSSATWVDFDFGGHQLVTHLAPVAGVRHRNAVDGHDVPVLHFGLVLEWAAWTDLAERLQSAGTEFVIAPHTRFEGQAGEQATMFLHDPAGNALEFKSFRDIGQMFAR